MTVEIIDTSKMTFHSILDFIEDCLNKNDKTVYIMSDLSNTSAIESYRGDPIVLFKLVEMGELMREGCYNETNYYSRLTFAISKIHDKKSVLLRIIP